MMNYFHILTLLWYWSTCFSTRVYGLMQTPPVQLVMETATPAATSKNTEIKAWQKSISLGVLYISFRTIAEISLSHTPDPPQPSPQPSCRLQPLALESQQLKQHPIPADIIMTARAEKIAQHVSQPLPFMHLSAVSCDHHIKQACFSSPNPIFPN